MKTVLFALSLPVILTALVACSSDDSGGSGGASGSSGKTGAGGSSGSGAGGSSGSSGKGGSSGNAGSAGNGGESGNGGASGDGGTSGNGGSSGAGTLPVVGGCTMFTADDAWNTPVDGLQADAGWTARLMNLVGDVNLHPDYGNYGSEVYGIPINVVPQAQPLVDIVFDWYPDQSDPGPLPYPGPGEIKIEGNDPMSCGGDCHVLVVQEGACMLYEGYACAHQGGTWHCGGGATWDMKQNSYGQRPMGWTSADAAGLSIAAGLIRYDEVMAGAINHAVRFTVDCTKPNYVKPASHYAVPDGCDPSDPNAPPMGLRVRLKASYDISGFDAPVRTVLTAFKKYGLILADNGSNFYFQAESHPGWTDEMTEPLKDVPAAEFEVVEVPPLEP